MNVGNAVVSGLIKEYPGYSDEGVSLEIISFHLSIVSEVVGGNFFLLFS